MRGLWNLKGFKNILGLSTAAGLLIFAVPRLEAGQGFTAPTIFAILWIGIVLLIIAAHLHELMGVDEETRQELEKVKRYKRWKMENYIRSKAVQRGK